MMKTHIWTLFCAAASVFMGANSVFSFFEGRIFCGVLFAISSAMFLISLIMAVIQRRKKRKEDVSGE